MFARLSRHVAVSGLVGGALMFTGSTAFAQRRTLHVVGDDGEPVAYATVTLAGERPRITDEKGDVELGPAERALLSVDVRRLGYEPWYATITLGGTVTIANVTLHRISRRLFTVKVTDTTRAVPMFLRGFYERMLARQHGIGSGIYLTPEEIEKRSTNMATSLLQALNGVSLQHTASGKIIAMSANGSCQMAVLIDGHRICPQDGCDIGASTPPPPPPSGSGGIASRRGRSLTPRGQAPDADFVLIDNLVSVTDVAAIEVYPRGAAIPPSLPTVDASCGLVVFWTGGRKAP